MTPVRLEPAALRSRVKHSTTEPLRSLCVGMLSVIVAFLVINPSFLLIKCTWIATCSIVYKDKTTNPTDTRDRTISSSISCADPEGGGGGWQGVQTPPPQKNYKNIGFLSDTGPDPLKNHKATKLAFNIGPSSARQRNAI